MHRRPPLGEVSTRAAQPTIAIVLVRVYQATPSVPCSLVPEPEPLRPPNGIWTSQPDVGRFTDAWPVSTPSANASALSADSAAEYRGSETVAGVVGGVDRGVEVSHGRDGDDWAEDLFCPDLVIDGVAEGPIHRVLVGNVAPDELRPSRTQPRCLASDLGSGLVAQTPGL
jgi:hypothetical protein